MCVCVRLSVLVEQVEEKQTSIGGALFFLSPFSCMCCYLYDSWCACACASFFRFLKKYIYSIFSFIYLYVSFVFHLCICLEAYVPFIMLMLYIKIDVFGQCFSEKPVEYEICV